jgi:hypothetical protein
MQKIFLRFFPFIMALLIMILIRTLDASPLVVVGLFMTVTLTIMAFIMESASAKMSEAVDIGDVTTNQDIDISDQQRPLPAVLNPFVQSLINLGFRRLGEVAVYTVKGRKIGTEWDYVSADGKMVASVVPCVGCVDGAMLQFTSQFVGNAWLLTTYPSGFPKGETINLPDFRFHHVRTSLPDAYQHHRQQMDDFAKTRGAPLTIYVLQDYLATSPIFRKRYGKLTLRRLEFINKYQSTLLGVLALLTLIITLVGSPAPEIALAAIVALFSLYCLLLSWLIPAHPRGSRLLRLGIFLLFGLIPIIFIFPWIVFGHLFCLGTLLLIHQHFIPAELRALAKELDSDESDPEEIRRRVMGES